MNTLCPATWYRTDTPSTCILSTDRWLVCTQYREVSIHVNFTIFFRDWQPFHYSLVPFTERRVIIVNKCGVFLQKMTLKKGKTGPSNYSRREYRTYSLRRAPRGKLSVGCSALPLLSSRAQWRDLCTAEKPPYPKGSFLLSKNSERATY